MTEEQMQRVHDLLYSCDSREELCERIVTLEDENAKLRECLQDLAEHIREDDGFGLDYGWMLDRMRGLGVDVP